MIYDYNLILKYLIITIIIKKIYKKIDLKYQ